jgi:hypothetical protein
MKKNNIIKNLIINNNKQKKKGIYFSIDAILALFILVITITSLSIIYYNEKPKEQLNYYSKDIINYFSTTKISELNNTYIDILISNQTITNINSTIIEEVLRLWATNNKNIATNIIKNLTNKIILDEYNIAFVIDNEIVYLINNSVTPKEISTHKSLITGIEESKAITGTSIRIFFSKTGDYTTKDYVYFGGFTGQGNISHNIYLPSDFTEDKLIHAQIKAEIPGDFYIFINNNLCGGLNLGESKIINIWDLNSCKSFFTPNKNTIKINFISTLNESYISGGYIKTEYNTETIKEDLNSTKKKYEFPAIKGLINLYDSLSAQGVITKWKLNVTFYNEYDTFLTLGNETIFYAPGKNETQNIVLNQNVMYPPTQIPLRMGVTNLSNVTVITEGKVSDSILVTDVSGSMNTCGIEEYEDVTYCRYEYRWWLLWFWTECEYTGSCSSNECGGGTTTRNHQVFTRNETVCKATFMDIAKNASKSFVNFVLDESLEHKIGLVDYSTNANSYLDLTNVRSVLHNEIDNYNANGWTCTCCGLNRARSMVSSSDNHKFIILMSDGDPNYMCTTTDDTTGSSTDFTNAANSAKASAQRICNENITIFSIGFGDLMSEQGKDLMKELTCNNESHYYDATNVEDLALIYEQISQEILLKANYSSQTINVVGNFSLTEIFDGSYFELEYIPYLTEDTYGTIPITFESDNFDSCNAQIFIPDKLEIKDAFITSFSGNMWTKKLKVNNDFIYDLDIYNTDYSVLGDPFQIQIPSAYIVSNALNNFTLEVGDNPLNNSNCSKNNSLIYTGLFNLLNASIPYSSVLPNAIGCTWKIEHESGKIMSLKIPEDYSGSKICDYNSSSFSINNIDQEDSYDMAMYYFLSYIDYDNNGKIFIDFDDSELLISSKLIRDIPYLWGPSIFEVRIWK